VEQVACKHNPDIECGDQSKCEACGWNPAVAKERIRKRNEAKARLLVLAADAKNWRQRISQAKGPGDGAVVKGELG